jgi:hypothetical protein
MNRATRRRRPREPLSTAETHSSRTTFRLLRREHLLVTHWINRRLSFAPPLPNSTARYCNTVGNGDDCPELVLEFVITSL